MTKQRPKSGWPGSVTSTSVKSSTGGLLTGVLRCVLVRHIQPHNIQTHYPHVQRLMMSSKDGVGQIIKTCVTVGTCIALTRWFRVSKATLHNLWRRTRGTHNAVGPAQLTHCLRTRHLVDEMLDVDLHGRTPVRDRGMGYRQYT